MIRFETPLALLTLLLPPLFLYWKRKSRRKRPAVEFSSLARVGKLPPTLRQRLSVLPSVFRLLAWCLLGIALARPQSGSEQVHDASQGIAIQMVLDRSTSMSQEMEYDRRRMNRLEAVKEVFSDFIFGNNKHDLAGRPRDLIGIITFARYPDTICPLTLGHDALPPLLESIQMPQQRTEDGTNIGDALALAAARLQVAEETMAKQNRKNPASYKIKSKIIILLTDGENNCGDRTIDEAATLAKKWGIKVYAIAVTSDQPSRGRGLAGFMFPAGLPHFDTRPLQALAESTGGLFRQASDAHSLAEIYREIDQLERSEVESLRFVNYKELFLPFALSAFALIALQLILTATIFRRIP